LTKDIITLKDSLEIVPTTRLDNAMLRNRNMNLFMTCKKLYSTLEFLDGYTHPEELEFFEEIKDLYLKLGNKILNLPQYKGLL
jgi:hypothetical protein